MDPLMGFRQGALICMEKDSREMLQEHSSGICMASLFDGRSPVFGNDKWPILNHPGRCSYPILHNKRKEGRKEGRERRKERKEKGKKRKKERERKQARKGQLKKKKKNT